MSDDDHTTLLNLKIRSTPKSRQVATLALILLCFFGALGIMAVFQLVLCRSEHPSRTVSECLMPATRKVKP